MMMCSEYKHQCPASDFKSIHIKTIQVNIKIYSLTFRCYIATSSELSNELTKVVSIIFRLRFPPGVSIAAMMMCYLTNRFHFCVRRTVIDHR